jgi:hypothetical protein
MRSQYGRAMLFIFAVVVVFNGIDLYSTYLASPDLSREWNVLHRELNLGWAGLVFAKIIGGWLAVAGYGYYLRNRERCYPAPGLDFVQFCHFYLFGEEDDRCSARNRDTTMRALVTLGCLWAGMQIVLLWVAIDNLLLYHGIVLRVGMRQEWIYHVAQSMTVAFAVIACMFVVNYRRYTALAGAHEHAGTREIA